MSQEVEIYQSLAVRCEQDAKRDFKEAMAIGFLTGAATIASYEVADNISNEIVSDSVSQSILVLGAAVTATVLVAGATAGYLNKREAKAYRKEAERALHNT